MRLTDLQDQNTYWKRWEFIKENKKVRWQKKHTKKAIKKKEKHNTLLTKKAIKKKRNNENGHEKKIENTLSAKKATKKKKIKTFSFFFLVSFFL